VQCAIIVPNKEPILVIVPTLALKMALAAKALTVPESNNRKTPGQWVTLRLYQVVSRSQ